jgi:hypothetical protein
MSCALSRLENVDPLLTIEKVVTSEEACSLFDGLVLKKEQLVLDSSFFDCCGGKGTTFVDDSQMGTGSVLRCGLNKRFTRSSALFGRYKELFFKDSPKDLGPDQISFLTSWARKLKEGEKLGQAIQIDSVDNSVMWSIAFFFCWHMDLNPKVIYLNKDFESSIFDGIEKYDFILLDGLSKLWDSTEQLKLDRLINYCYSSMIPLWIFFPKSADKKYIQKSSSRTLKQYEKKLAKLKAQNPIKQLPESTLIKLKDICLGTERIS